MPLLTLAAARARLSTGTGIDASEGMIIEESDNPFEVSEASAPPMSDVAFGNAEPAATPPPPPANTDLSGPPPAAAAARASAAPASGVAASYASFQDLEISPTAAMSSAAMPPSSFNPAAAFERGGGASAGGSPDLVISVANPSKQGEGQMSAFYTYEVTTKTSLPQYAFGQFAVTRRFRDFDWLHAQLVAKFPGAIVPPLPEKHAAQVSTLKVTGQAQSATFLEERRASLQRFLQQLATHPTLHTAADLQAFLEKPEDSLDAWKELAKPKSSASLAQSLATETKASLFTAYNKGLSYFNSEGSGPSAGFEPAQDLPCQQMANYATALQGQVTSVHKHSKSYIERNKALGQSMTGFGLALTQLSNCESAINESLSRGISHMGLTVGRLSATYAEKAEREQQTFEEPMKHYVRLLGAVKTAIAAREHALKSYNSASSGLAGKKERLERMRSSGGKEDKVSALAREVADAEEAVTQTKAEYETVAARVDAEMGRFQTEKLADFKRFVVGFAKLQLEYSERIQATWKELLPRLDEITGVDGAD